MKSYEFKNIKQKIKKRIISISIIGIKINLQKDQLKFRALEKGAFYTRDLVSEPGNVLHPDEYAKRLKNFKKRRFENKYL